MWMGVVRMQEAHAGRGVRVQEGHAARGKGRGCRAGGSPVVEHNVCRLEQLGSAEREQAWVARASADKEDLAGALGGSTVCRRGAGRGQRPDA